MGKTGSKESGENVETKGDEGKHVNFDDFELIRAIGRGAFGKVCLVRLRSEPSRTLAMKCVNKQLCLKQGSVRNIVTEVEIMRSLDHVFIVNLWYSFQDAEDLFVILEALSGGDLRYHLRGGRRHFDDAQSLFLCLEVACALDYLREKRVIHRDVKPDNILLDDKGHAHLTDFNVALRVDRDGLGYGLAGTRPYMAPEVFADAEKRRGYSFAVDWWSLGITLHELRTGSRPASADATADASSADALPVPARCSSPVRRTLRALLRLDDRPDSLQSLREEGVEVSVDKLRCSRPPFKPDSLVLNCDPTLELEEMIVESRPLHKKKKRLLVRQQTLKTLQMDAAKSSDLEAQRRLEEIERAEKAFADFPCYNRDFERHQAALRAKEQAWEAELHRLMVDSDSSKNFLSATTTMLRRGSASIVQKWNDVTSSISDSVHSKDNG